MADTLTEGEVGEYYAPNDAIILNYSQTPVKYEAVPKVWLTHPDSTEEAPTLVPFTYGELVEGTEITPDFSAGDMEISVPDGSLVKDAVILKPETLIPENIRQGVSIAGVEGEFAGADTEEVTVELSMANGDQVITPPTDGNAMSKVTVKKPGTLIPENIAEGVDIAGVVGTLAAGSPGKSALVYSAVKHFNTTSGVIIASKSDLAACGIDLTQFTSWYKSGQAYVPFIRIAKLVDVDLVLATNYRCVYNAWISNIACKPSSGSYYDVGQWTWVYTDNSKGGTIDLKTLKTVTNPLALPSNANTNRLLYVSNGDVRVELYSSSSVQYSMVGDYLVTVMLIPVS